MISFEYSEAYPKTTVVTISRWLSSEKRVTEWRSSNVDPNRAILIGNVDEDELDELILFDEDFGAKSQSHSFLIVNWQDGQFRASRTNQISGAVAALIDFENDGIEEIVIAKRRIEARDRNLDGLFPSDLLIYSLVEPYQLVDRIELDSHVEALTVGDITGDGFREVLTVESSNDGRIKGRLSVYTANRDEGFERVFTENHFVDDALSFFEVFEYDGRKYLFLEQHWKQWKTILGWAFTHRDGLKWQAVDARYLELIREAMRHTIVCDQNERAVEQYTTPEYQTVFVRSQMCGEPANRFIDED